MPLGTAAALAIALGSAGATAASNIYSTRSAAGINRRSLDLQATSDQQAADEARATREASERLERDRMAAAEAARQDAIALDKQRWNDYVTAHTPQWQAGQRILQSLFEMANVQPGSMPVPQMPSADQPPPPGQGLAASAPPRSNAMPQTRGPATSLYDLAAGGPVSSGQAMAGRVPSRGRQIAATMPMPTAQSGMSLMDLANLASMTKDVAYSRAAPFDARAVIPGASAFG
jgi:hypothetical protein